MAQLKETKIYGGLDVYSAYSGNNDEIQWLKLARNDTGDIKLDIYATNTNIYNPLRVDGTLEVVNGGGQFIINDSYNDTEICHFNSSEIIFKSFDKIKNTNKKTLYDYINETVKEKGVYTITATDTSVGNFYLIGSTENSSNYSSLLKLSSVYIAGDGQINAISFKGTNFYATSDERLKENIELL